jgi:hypothetical protein
LRSAAKTLLIYAYGTGLTERGNLAGFARAVGIEIADAGADVRASIAVDLRGEGRPGS